MLTKGAHDGPRSYPRLPVLGWSSFAGRHAAPLPGLLDAAHRRLTLSGRAAIGLALRVLGVEPGDKVLVPTYHCPTMIAPVAKAGAQPMFYPITAEGGPDLDWLRQANLRGARVLLATHYFGLPQPMSVVREFCVAHGLALIEDCAHALFGISDGLPVGGWGDVSIASLAKFFPVPEGGMIASATRPLTTLELEPRGWHGEIKAAADAIELGVAYGRFPGLNSLLAGVFRLKNGLRHGDNSSSGGAADPLLSPSRPALAARWIARTVHRSRIVELRRRNYAELARRLAGISGARSLHAELPASAAPYVFPLYVDDPEASYQRLRGSGIPIFRWDEVWPGTPVIEGDHGLDWSTHVFQLGCHQDLSLDDLNAIATTVRTVIENPAHVPAGAATRHANPGREAAPAMARKRILMVAFHFPPLAGGSGTQRTLQFARHLPAHGWEPLILTANARAYERVSDDQLDDVPRGTIVERAFALDSSRHLAVMGHYPAFTARPDRWASWWYNAVLKGLAMIRRYRPQVIWSTYPIAAAHKIGATLHRLSGVPWVADFRDLMAQEGYPADRLTRLSFQRIEERAIRTAAASVFVTPGAANLYHDRYPDVPRQRLTVIENGYDDESFAILDRVRETSPLLPGTLTLVHSGVVYPSERDPTHLFAALRRMLDEGSLKPADLRVRLRASAHEGVLQRLIERHQVAAVVELAPPIAYRQALREMLRADGLLVLQAGNCNQQIPAKVYEYLRCRRPILALTDPAGDTAALLRRAGIDHVARLDSTDDIARELARFLERVKRGTASMADETVVSEASRRNRARELAALLDRVAALPASEPAAAADERPPRPQRASGAAPT